MPRPVQRAAVTLSSGEEVRPESFASQKEKRTRFYQKMRMHVLEPVHTRQNHSASPVDIFQQVIRAPVMHVNLAFQPETKIGCAVRTYLNVDR
jgi:hypothetical protein